MLKLIQRTLNYTFRSIPYLKPHAQSYHSAIYRDEFNKNKLQTPARIEKIDGDISLQTLNINDTNSHHLGPFFEATPTFSRTRFAHGWSPMLRISSAGKKLTLDIPHDTRVQQVMANTKDSYKRVDSILTCESPDKIIYPQKLYAIKQTIWEEFIGQLANQEVVHLLKLAEHPHLWAAYDVALSAPSPDLVIKRASLISAHHFLLHAAIIAQYLSLNSSHHLYSGSLDAKYIDLSTTKKISKTIFDNLDHGSLPTIFKDIASYTPLLTPTLFKKFSHCTSLYEIMRLADMVDSYSRLHTDSTSEEPIEKRKLDATSWIPSSATQPHEFAHSLSVADTLLKKFPIICPNSAGMFFTSRKKWANYNKTSFDTFELKDMHDYTTALFNDLILSYILQQFDVPLSILVSKIEGRASKIFSDLLANSSSLCQLNNLQKRWHENIQAIADLKPETTSSTNAIWQPLINNMILDEIDIKVLTTKAELDQHGKEMNHCVGTYLSKCLDNKCDIIVLTDSNGTKSTIELILNKTKDYWIEQHRGYGNLSIKSTHAEVAKKLVHMINHREIKLNQARVNEHPKQFSRDYYLNIYPYDINDSSIQEKIYEIYKTRQVLPSILIAPTYEAMLKKNRLNRFNCSHNARTGIFKIVLIIHEKIDFMYHSRAGGNPSCKTEPQAIELTLVLCA